MEIPRNPGIINLCIHSFIYSIILLPIYIYIYNHSICVYPTIASQRQAIAFPTVLPARGWTIHRRHGHGPIHEICHSSVGITRSKEILTSESTNQIIIGIWGISHEISQIYPRYSHLRMKSPGFLMGNLHPNAARCPVSVLPFPFPCDQSMALTPIKPRRFSVVKCAAWALTTAEVGDHRNPSLFSIIGLVQGNVSHHVPSNSLSQSNDSRRTCGFWYHRTCVCVYIDR